MSFIPDELEIKEPPIIEINKKYNPKTFKKVYCQTKLLAVRQYKSINLEVYNENF